MFKTRFQPKASALCATGTLLVLGGFLSLNLAGCGGGGNGLGQPSASATPTPATTGLSFQLQLPDGTASSGGTVTLTGGRTFTGTANSSGLVRLRNVPGGLYNVVFTTIDGNGNRVSTTRSLTITPNTGTGAKMQFFTLVQGNTGDPASNPFTVTGTVFLNPLDASGNINPVSACGTAPEPVTDAIVIQVKDLNASNGQPIIAQVTIPAQPPNLAAPASGVTPTRDNTPGFYSIKIPYRPQSFQVLVSKGADAPFSGISSSASFPSSVAQVDGLDICANQSTTAPLPGSTPTPTPTLRPGQTPTVTATATPTTTATATATATVTVTTTATATATATTTATTVPTTPTTVPTTATVVPTTPTVIPTT